MLNKRSFDNLENQLQNSSKQEQDILMNKKQYLQTVKAIIKAEGLIILYSYRQGKVKRGARLSMFNKKYIKVTKFNDTDLIQQLKIYEAKINRKFYKFIKGYSYCKEISKFMNDIYHEELINRNYFLQRSINQGFGKLFNLKTSCNTNESYMFLSIFCIDVFKKGLSNVFLPNYNMYTIPKSILIYSQFSYIKKQILYHFSCANIYYIVYNSKNKEEYDYLRCTSIIKQIIKKTIKQDIINGNKDEVNKLAIELRKNNNDLYNNQTICNYIYKILNKLMPNAKNIQSKTYEKALKIVDKYKFLSIYTQNLNKKTTGKSLNPKVEQQFKKRYLSYANKKVIKDNFYDPMLELNKNTNNINQLFHRIIADNLFDINDNEAKNNLQKMTVLIDEKIEEYKNLLSKIKTISLNARHRTFIICNKFNNDYKFAIYKVKNELNSQAKLIQKNELMGYFTLVYHLLCGIIFPILNDHYNIFTELWSYYTKKGIEDADLLHKKMIQFHEDLISEPI